MGREGHAGTALPRAWGGGVTQWRKGAKGDGILATGREGPLNRAGTALPLSPPLACRPQLRAARLEGNPC